MNTLLVHKEVFVDVDGSPVSLCENEQDVLVVAGGNLVDAVRDVVGDVTGDVLCVLLFADLLDAVILFDAGVFAAVGGEVEVASCPDGTAAGVAREACNLYKRCVLRTEDGVGTQDKLAFVGEAIQFPTKGYGVAEDVDALCCGRHIYGVCVEDVIGCGHPKVEVLCALGADDVLARQEDEAVAVEGDVADGLTNEGWQGVAVVVPNLPVVPRAALKDKAAVSLPHEFVRHGGGVET